MLPEKLPDDINAVRWKNAITVNIEFFDAMVEKLISFLHSKPRRKSALRWLIPVAAVCIVAVAAAFFLLNRGKSALLQWKGSKRLFIILRQMKGLCRQFSPAAQI